jgi:ATP synthase protein I
MSSEPPKPTDSATPPATPKRNGWLSDLAQRSTGLPGPDAETPPPKPLEKSAWSYAGIGLQFAATTAVFTCMGLYMDGHWGTSPWGTLGLTLLGLVGGMYLLIKESLKFNADPDKNAGSRRHPKDGRP